MEYWFLENALPILTYVAVPIVLLDWGAFFIFAYLAARRPIPQLRTYLLLEALNSLLTTYLMFLLFGGGFGPGAFIMLGSIPATLFAIAAFWPVLARNRVRLSADARRRRIYLVGTIAIVLFTGLPAVTYFPVKSACTQINRRAAEPLIHALTDYQHDQGRYPDNLEQLVPNHLPMIPRPPCSRLGLMPWEYKYLRESDDYVIVIATVDLVGCDRFFSRQGVWHYLYSFLDGSC